jgi:formamidopyrimidine-DNA glycosylase
VPELPDVEGYRRTLHDHALRRPIRTLDALDAAVLRNASEDEARRAFVGHMISSDERRGKWLIARAEKVDLVLHFGMTGRLEWLDAAADLGRFVRLRIGFTDGSLVYRDPRRLSGVWVCVDDRAISEVTGPLGPDALGITFLELDERLGARRGSIKASLMNQHVIAGIGNMLSDEVLWRSGVSPTAGYWQLSVGRRKELHRALGAILRSSARVGAIPRTKGWLNSQRGTAHPACPRGHGPLTSTKVGGRTALWCSVCQSQV